MSEADYLATLDDDQLLAIYQADAARLQRGDVDQFTREALSDRVELILLLLR